MTRVNKNYASVLVPWRFYAMSTKQLNNKTTKQPNNHVTTRL